MVHHLILDEFPRSTAAHATDLGCSLYLDLRGTRNRGANHRPQSAPARRMCPALSIG